MSYPKVANIGKFPNQEVIIYNDKNFFSKLQNLGSRLDNIESSLEENNTEESKKTIKIINQYLNILEILEKKYNGSQTNGLQPTNSSTGPIDPKNTIQSLKKYLRSRKWIYHNMRNHTEILNTYWYSKAETEIIEEIDSCLDSFRNELVKLER